ncbi:MAG: 3D domain-containing protein [Clostridium sp.]|nr:3D domain-containing protein [Clostridium sp.]
MLADINIYNKKVDKEKSKENESKETSTSYKATYTMEATAYTGDSITATGTTPIRNEEGLSTIAVDPSVIPLGSKVYIPGYGEAIASDTGSAIKGNKIDLFFNSKDECAKWGRQNVTLYILEYPGE